MSDEVQQKLLDDPRYKSMLRDRGRVYAASLDSMPALYLEEFYKIFVDSVNQYFNNDIYQQGLQKHKETYTEEYINNTRNHLVKEFAEGLE
jgi:hypothetical protein